MPTIKTKGKYISKKSISEIYVRRGDLEDKVSKELADIREEIESKTTEIKCHVLNYYGIGGIGKTSLRDHIADLIEKKGRITLDFEQKVFTERQIIEDFLEKMKDIGICDFYCTTSAIIKLCEKEGKPFDGTVTSDLEDICKSKTSRILSILIKQIPTIGILIGFAQEINAIINDPNDRPVDKMLSILEKKAKEIDDEDSYKCVKDIRCKNYSKDELEKNLFEYLSLDLQVIMSKRKEPLVIFIDTYEKYFNTFTNDRSSLSALEEWIRKLIVEVPYVLWVISGREKIRENIEGEWNEIGPSMNEVRCFTEDEIKKYMTNIGVDLSLFPLFSRLSEGIPYYLSLLCNTYEMNLNKEGKEAALDESKYGINKASIAERYLKRFDDDIKDLLKQLVTIDDGWDDEMLEAGVIKDFDKAEHTKLIESSLVKYNRETHKYTIPEPIRKAIVGFVDPELIDETKKRLYDYILRVVKNESETAGLTNIEQLLKCSTIEQKESLFEDLMIPRINSYLGSYKMEEARILLDDYLEVFTHSKNIEFKVKYLASEEAFFHHKGNYETALEKAEEGYQLCKEEYGEHHPATLVFLNNIASCLRSLEKYDEALEKSEECYEVQRKVLSEEHLATLATLNNMALCLKSLGYYYDALEKFKECYEGSRKVLSEDNPNTINVLYNMAGCLYKLGIYEEALEKYAECYEESRQVLPESHPDTFNALDDMVLCLSSLGRYDETLEKHEECYEGIKKVLFEDNPDTITTLNNMALCLIPLGRYEEALEKFEECYKRFRQVLPESHPYVLKSLGSVADCLRLLGRYDEALEKFEESYEGLKVLPESYIYTLNVLNNIALCLKSLERYDEALEKFEESYEGLKVLPESHFYTLATLGDMADCLRALRRYDEALEKYEECYEESRKVLYEDHPYTLDVLNNMADCLRALGRDDEVLERYEEYYEAKRKTPPDTFVEDCLRAFEEFFEALDEYE